METPGLGGDVINREVGEDQVWGTIVSWKCLVARSRNALWAPGNSSSELRIKGRADGVNLEVNSQDRYIMSKADLLLPRPHGPDLSSSVLDSPLPSSIHALLNSAYLCILLIYSGSPPPFTALVQPPSVLTSFTAKPPTGLLVCRLHPLNTQPFHIKQRNV